MRVLSGKWQQFWLLVLMNGFVGAMVGLERTLVPRIAADEFGLVSISVTLSFIVSFGIVKALANLAAGRSADRFGRKPVLIAGWLVGLPVPVLVMLAPTWEWIVLANVLLGINQGLCWSTAVIMKIDLMGSARRGFAIGMNEFAGYAAMALTTAASGYIAAQTALRPYPFYMGIGFAAAGLILALGFIRETRAASSREQTHAHQPSFWSIVRRVSWQDKTLFSLSQAGFINNLNDVVVWGLLPLMAVQARLSLEQAATLGGLYLATWGISQLFTGALSDRVGRRPLITGGLVVQASGIFLFAISANATLWAIAIVVMGLGTGMVYPTLLAAVSDATAPNVRASSLGVYRLWRDSGYAAGALVGGLVADLISLQAAVLVIAVLTFAATGITVGWLPETRFTSPAAQGGYEVS